MEKLFNLTTYDKYPLFNDINQNGINIIMNCFKISEKEYKKGSYIWHAGDEAVYVGIVVDGQVNIVKDNIFGDRTIINIVSPMQIFGESFAISKKNTYPVSIQALSDSIIILIDKEKLITPCAVSCSFHTQLIKNLLGIIANKNISLSKRIESITKKTIKEKLIFYLMEEMRINQMKNAEIKIPFNRKELSEYINVNRSALSRVLSSLEEDNIISFNKNKFKILDLEKVKKIMNG